MKCGNFSLKNKTKQKSKRPIQSRTFFIEKTCVGCFFNIYTQSILENTVIIKLLLAWVNITQSFIMADHEL